MPSATVTSKGQITIPKAIREALGLEPGDRVAFRLDADGSVVVEPETLDLRELFAVLKPRVKGVSIDDMRRAVQDRGSRR
jgi:AbrB family looped-hinge helix DNA binding protein